MSEMENPHNYRKVGYSMILVAASLSAIGMIHLAIGDNVLFGDDMQRDKTAFFEECKAIFYATEECQKFVKAGNTLYEIPKLDPNEMSEDVTVTESDVIVPTPVIQSLSETVIIPESDVEEPFVDIPITTEQKKEMP